MSRLNNVNKIFESVDTFFESDLGDFEANALERLNAFAMAEYGEGLDGSERSDLSRISIMHTTFESEDVLSSFDDAGIDLDEIGIDVDNPGYQELLSNGLQVDVYADIPGKTLFMEYNGTKVYEESYDSEQLFLEALDSLDFDSWCGGFQENIIDYLDKSNGLDEVENINESNTYDLDDVFMYLNKDITDEISGLDEAGERHGWSAGSPYKTASGKEILPVRKNGMTQVSAVAVMKMVTDKFPGIGISGDGERTFGVYNKEIIEDQDLQEEANPSVSDDIIAAFNKAREQYGPDEVGLVLYNGNLETRDEKFSGKDVSIEAVFTTLKDFEDYKLDHNVSGYTLRVEAVKDEDGVSFQDGIDTFLLESAGLDQLGSLAMAIDDANILGADSNTLEYDKSSNVYTITLPAQHDNKNDRDLFDSFLNGIGYRMTGSHFRRNGVVISFTKKEDLEEDDSLVGQKYKCIKGMSHPNMGPMFKKGQTYKLTDDKGETITLGGWNINKRFLDTNFELVTDNNLKEEQVSENVMEAARYMYDDFKGRQDLGDIADYESFSGYTMDITEEEYKQAIEVIENLPEFETYEGLIQLSDNRTMNNIDIADGVNPEEAQEIYGNYVEMAVEDFQQESGVEVYLEGRSGRHVCVQNTFDNAMDYNRLCDIQQKCEQMLISNVNNALAGNDNGQIEESTLNETILSDDIESQLGAIKNRIVELRKTFKYEIDDEVISIDAAIEALNNEHNLGLEKIGTENYNLNGAESEIDYALKNSEWSKEDQLEESESIQVGQKYKCTKGMSHPNQGPMFKKGQVYTVDNVKDEQTITLGGWNIYTKYLDTNFEPMANEKELSEGGSVDYWIENIGFDPTKVEYSEQAESIINAFFAADKMDELWDYLAAGITEPFTNVEDWIKYVEGTDINDFEVYNGPLNDIIE